MDRDTALRIDGMVRGINGTLDNLAAYIKKSCAPAEARVLIRLVGSALYESFQIGDAVWKQYPDIYPIELRPELESQKPARKASKKAGKGRRKM